MLTPFDRLYIKDNDESKPRGLILKGVGGRYTVLLSDYKEVFATPRGAIRQKTKIPYPGDLVELSKTGDELIPYAIEKVLPRKTFINRPAVANLDALIITCSAKDPVTDLVFIDKMIIICAKEGIDPIICITKADLDVNRAKVIKNEYKNIGAPIFQFGFNWDESNDFEEFKNYISGKIISFAGQSGVGKSTLLNRIAEKKHMLTGSISSKNKRGKHTTRHAEIFIFEDSLIVDTPGFSTIEFKDLDVTGEDVLKGYPEVKQYEDSCKFTSCRHIGEKGCAVEENSENKSRLERYRAFRKEADSISKYK